MTIDPASLPSVTAFAGPSAPSFHNLAVRGGRNGARGPAWSGCPCAFSFQTLDLQLATAASPHREGIPEASPARSLGIFLVHGFGVGEEEAARSGLTSRVPDAGKGNEKSIVSRVDHLSGPLLGNSGVMLLTPQGINLLTPRTRVHTPVVGICGCLSSAWVSLGGKGLVIGLPHGKVEEAGGPPGAANSLLCFGAERGPGQVGVLAGLWEGGQLPPLPRLALMASVWTATEPPPWWGRLSYSVRAAWNPLGTIQCFFHVNGFGD